MISTDKLKFWTSCDTNFKHPCENRPMKLLDFFSNMPRPTKRKAAHKKVNRNEQGKFTKEAEIP